VPNFDVDVGAVRGVFVRHIPRGGDPLNQAPHPADGRWQHGSVIEAWYLADEPPTAWAEWYRPLAGTGLPPARALPRDLWRWSVDLEHVALLDTEERLERGGLPMALPTEQQWPAYQDVGDALHREGHEGLLVVSAARPEHCNLDRGPEPGAQLACGRDP
jgi:RES domain-containing protein